ncbi:MAG: hypothetical protein QW670_05570 [Candidatus Bathyarchaeia archaeon]
MASLKAYIGLITGCILLIIGAIAGIYQLELHPKTSELLINPLGNILLVMLPFIMVFGLTFGVWLVWKSTEKS